MYDTCIMKEQIKKKSVEGGKVCDDCSRSTIKKQKRFLLMMDSCTHSVFLLCQRIVFLWFVFLCHNDRNRRTTVLVVRFVFAVLYCPLKK